MDITLYNYSGEPNRLDKSGLLTLLKTMTGTPRGEIGVMNTVITIEASASEVIDANYCYIQDWGRYYYVKQITNIVDGLWMLQVACDPLMSFKNDILDLTGIVQRNRDNYDMYLNDNEIPVSARKSLNIIPFLRTPYHSGFNDEYASVTMLVLGGGEP